MMDWQIKKEKSSFLQQSKNITLVWAENFCLLEDKTPIVKRT
jgi:hypothetical protein